MESKKIAVVGSKNSIIGFKMIGANIFDIDDYTEARSKIIELYKSTDYGIIFIMESIFKNFSQDDMSFFSKKALPVIIALPDGENSGYTTKNLESICIRALGKNILDK